VEGIGKNSVYHKNDPVYFEDKEYTDPKEYFKVVVNMIRSVYKNDPLSLIDVGCAAGGFIYYARRKLNLDRTVGIDISDMHLHQARRYMPDVDFVIGSIEDPSLKTLGMFDVCTCLGTLAIFDDIEEILDTLLSLINKGGYLYIFDVVNDYPVDMLMKYRTVQNEQGSGWQAGFNVRSIETYRKLFEARGIDAELNWVDFEMPFEIHKTPDPMRSWTMQTEYKKHQIVVGTGQLLDFKILCIRKVSY